MDNLTIFAQKSTKEKQPPVRGLNSLQGTPVDQAERLHKKQGWKLLSGLTVKELRSEQIKLTSELLLEIGALLINGGRNHRMRIRDKASWEQKSSGCPHSLDKARKLPWQSNVRVPCIEKKSLQQVKKPRKKKWKSASEKKQNNLRPAGGKTAESWQACLTSTEPDGEMLVVIIEQKYYY